MMRKKLLNFEFIIPFLFFLSLCVSFLSAENIDLEKRIDLDIKGMDIMDVFKLISLKSGLSIAPSPLVKGNVSIFLKNVKVWDAFEILIASNGLAYEKKGNMVIVMTNREYEEKYGKSFYDTRILKTFVLKHSRAEAVGKALSELKSRIGKVIADAYSNTVVVLDTPDVVYEMEKAVKKMDTSLKTEVFQLNFAKVENLQDKLQDIITKDVGNIKFDKRSNRIVVTDLPSKMGQIEKIIKGFDKKPKEVLIEAKIIKINLSDEYRYGVDWKSVFTSELGIGYKGTLPTTGSTSVGRLAIGEVAVDESSTLTRRHQYRGLFEILNTFGKTEVLSSPRLTVLDGQEAYVLIGEQEPMVTVSYVYPTGATSSSISESVKFVDIGLRLGVTPQISDTGDIIMKIKPEISELKEVYTTSVGSRYPVKSTSESETTVIVKDGATLILAGLMKEDTRVNKEKIPGLGDVPFVGKLFSGKYKKKEKDEFVIFITPHIVTGKGERVTTQRYPSISSKKGEMKLPEFEQKEEAKKVALKKVGTVIAEEKERQLYSEYYLKVTNKIYDYLRQNYLDLGLKGEVNVVFLLDNRGNLIGEPAVIGDVEPAIRDLAIEVVKKAGPYPAFPEGLGKNKEAFNILLSFGKK